MRTILAAALAFATLTPAALADGAVELTDTQLDQITAGVSVDNRPISSGGARFTYFTPRIATSRVANPGVNVARVGNVLAVYRVATPGVNVARTGNPVVNTVFIPSAVPE